MKNETFYYSKNLILEIIKTFKLDFLEDMLGAYNKYFINPTNPEDIQDALNKYIVNKKSLPNRILTEEEEYSLDFEKDKYREFKEFYLPKILKR